MLSSGCDTDVTGTAADISLLWVAGVPPACVTAIFAL